MFFQFLNSCHLKILTGFKTISDTHRIEVLMPSNSHSSTPTVMMANTAPFLLFIDFCPPGVEPVPRPVPPVDHCPEYQTVDIVAYNIPTM